MTVDKAQTLQTILTKANPNNLADALKEVNLGHLFAAVKVTFTGLASSASQDITTAAAKAAATISGMSLDTGENLPPIGSILGLRVTAGAAAAGARFTTDVDGTPSTTVATVSDDGKTLVFESTVTGFVLLYRPRSAADLSETFDTLV